MELNTTSSEIGTKPINISKKTVIWVSVAVGVVIFIVVVAVSIGLGFYFLNRDKKDKPKDVTFSRNEKWENVTSSGKPGDAGNPPTKTIGALSLFIKDQDITNGNWKPATSPPTQFITNVSPGSYRNNSSSTTYSFTLDVFFNLGTVTIPTSSPFDNQKQDGQYLIGFTTYKFGDSPPNNGRPNYGASSSRIIPSSLSARGTPISFSGLSGKFENVLLKPDEVLDISLNVLVTDKGTGNNPSVLGDVTFNVSSGNVAEFK